MMITVAVAMMVSPIAYADEVVDLNDKSQHKRGGKLFKKADKNDDGVVSKKEFVASLEARFDKIDADNSGDITKEEARAHAKSRRSAMKERKDNRNGDE